MITFIGQIDGAHVKAAVMFKGEIVSIDGPVSFTLDQWHDLRDLSLADDEENLWACTPDEYEAGTGERVSP